MTAIKLCPFGCEEPNCTHFVGWTENGRTIQPYRTATKEGPIRDTDRIVATGVTARIYRPQENTAKE